MNVYKMLGSAVLASTVLLVGCGDDQKAVEEKEVAPAVEQAVEPSAMDTLKKEAGETLQAAGDVMTEAKEDATEAAGDMADKAAEMGEDIKQDAVEAYEQAEEGMGDLKDKAVEAAADLEQKARDQVDAMQEREAESDSQ